MFFYLSTIIVSHEKESKPHTLTNAIYRHRVFPHEHIVLAQEFRQQSRIYLITSSYVCLIVSFAEDNEKVSANE